VLTTDTDTGAAEPDPPGVHRELRWHLVEGEFARLAPHRRVALSRHNHRVLDRHLDDLRPDVVAWWSMGGLALTMLETVRRRGIPAVGFVHDEWLDYGRWADPWLSWWAGRWRRLAPLAERVGRLPARVDFAGAAEYAFVSDYTRRHALGLGLGPLRTSVAHSGIETAYLDPAPERDWGWRLLYVGRLDPRKGVDVAVRALEHLPEQARLTIAGGWDRHEERRLRELAAAAGAAERVEFAGQRSVPELVELYGEADAVVFPVRWQEPWGLVPLEAMGRGRPVVASGRGGSAEYLRDGENALLFDAEDPRDLAAKLMRLADEPELRARLRANGLETAPRHTVPVFNAAVEEAVRRAAGEPVAPPRASA
jgi:glycosyltransferase involved in cell wall biosynthesis